MQLNVDASAASEGTEQLRSAPASPSHSWSSTETVPLQAELADAQSDPEQKRPKRCKITREQLAVLVKTFDEEPLPNFDQRQSLAKMLGMTPRSVQIWFQNRRQRLKPAAPKARDEAHGAPGQAWSHDSLLPHSSAPRPPLPGQGGQLPHQQYGMPGYSATPGLYPPGPYPPYEMWHLQQLHHGAGPNLGSLNLPANGDMMEPFAATKALLGAGYHPSSLLLRQLSGGAAGGGAGVASPGATPSTSEVMAADASAGAPVGAGAPAASADGAAASQEASKPEAAHGLLMLLACASGPSGS